MNDQRAEDRYPNEKSQSSVHFQISTENNTMTEDVVGSLEGRIMHTLSLHSNDSPILSSKRSKTIYSEVNRTL